MYKKAFKIYFKTLTFFIVTILTVVYVSDPYMLFHKKWFNKNKIYSNLRIQNYGIIKYEDFDSIIIGTSMLENTSAKEASSKLNSKFVNLSLSGSSFYERIKVLDLAFKKKHLKHVIYSLDYKFSKPNDVNNTFYPSLYDTENVITKLQIYMTSKALKCVFLNCKKDMISNELDRPKSWYKMPHHKRRFGGFKNWIKYHKKDHQIQGAFRELMNNNIDHKNAYKEYKQIIDNEILPVLQHKETQHSIIIPPYSVLWWAKRKDYLDEYFSAYSYLIEQTAKLSNVKIYWFYDEDFVLDIANYKDLTHYHYIHNSKQVDAIKNGTNIINSTNYLIKFSDFKSIVSQFNIEEYIAEVPNIYSK